MEARKITVVTTNSQEKKVIMSSAETLRELKSDLTSAGIDYTNMSFYEGISKTELLNDSSVLPSNVPYKGTVTNELVFLLSTSNKKIKSGGVDRLMLYDMIKGKKLESVCIQKYGKNFTRCKTSELEALIEESMQKEDFGTLEMVETTDKDLRKAFLILLDYLYNERVITENFYNREEFIKLENSIDIEKEEELNSSYDSEEIEDMFLFVEK